MKIAIIGAGAIGLLCAYQLKEKHDVILYVRSKKQYERILENGIYYKANDLKKNRTVHVRFFEEWNGQEELTIVAVKQYQLAAIYEKMEELGDKIKAMCFLQNGMGHFETIKNSRVANILIGIVEHGAMTEDEQTVIHTGIGAIKIACIKGEMDDILTTLTTATIKDFLFIKEHNYEIILQKKLVVNCLVNSLTSILHVQNGVLLENDYYSQVMTMFMDEILDILTVTGADKKIYREYCMEVIRKTALNKSSMLKDIEAGRPTEIDAILGYIIGEAKKKKQNMPITMAVYLMIKGKERGREVYTHD